MVLPGQGVEWLNVRLASKQIKNGKFDLDVLIWNMQGEVEFAQPSRCLDFACGERRSKASSLCQSGVVRWTVSAM